jgi:hypothetical protein
MAIPYQYHSKIKKALSSSSADLNPGGTSPKLDLSIFVGKPFWIYDKDQHKEQFIKTNGHCCFNHIIGLPVKNNKTYPIFDYELDVIKAIESNRNIWIKKASGIGATELILRYLTYKILVNADLEFKNIFIISGTYVIHANELKVRMENLFRKRFPFLRLESKFTDLWIRNTNIKIFPSRNVKDLRGYTDVSYLFIDEADHFEQSVTNELLHAITRYEEKSNCTTIMVSTPNAPGGLFESIEKDPNSKYHKIILSYEVGLNKMYDPLEIAKKKLEPEFAREYECKYLGRIGNLLAPLQVDEAVKSAGTPTNDGVLLEDIPISQYTLKCVGIDPGFSSSKTAIVMTEHLKDQDKIIVRLTKEYDKGNPNVICDELFNLHKQYWNTYFLIDGSNRAMVNLLKIKFDESLDWDTKDTSPESMRVVPVNFSTDHKSMLSHLHMVITKGYLAIPEKHDKLIISLRTAWARELSLDKEQTSYNDLLDALRLSLKGYNIE